ncbi:MAG TPA: hypothetical protein VGC98_13340 [Thermoleophilaceae bacterium]|jgi:hypothetical protein
MDKETLDSKIVDSRVWHAPEVTVLGTLKAVTEANSTMFGDNVANQGPLPGDSGSTS